MLIGLDFDNTIVSYDALFHKVAREWEVVPAGTPVSKLAVRDHLRRAGQEDRWTELQGHVYGARMDEAEVYGGVIEFLQWARAAGHMLAIVSHKTRHPFLGPRYDLHAAAKQWIACHLVTGGVALVPEGRVFFELTKEEKIARIHALGCDAFIDDLPEILLCERFPASALRLLFDPEAHHPASSSQGLTVLRTWSDAARSLRARVPA